MAPLADRAWNSFSLPSPQVQMVVCSISSFILQGMINEMQKSQRLVSLVFNKAWILGRKNNALFLWVALQFPAFFEKVGGHY